MSGRKLARRACDGCKVRKIKCSETSPCEGCKNAGIACTWLKQAQPRGPRRLRDATLQEIRKAQDILQAQNRNASATASSKSPNVTDPDPPPRPSSEISHIVLFLCVYRVQLYPIWPIIKVERLIASLQSDTPDIEVFALAYALAAATAMRTESTDLGITRKNHAKIMEEKCQAARAKVPNGRPPNLTTVRIAFFLHVYYEMQDGNSMKSMLYLREAITIAQMIGLHKEAYYTDIPIQEREIRRRVLWLLFITERVVSILYDQPITLRTKITIPSTTDTDEIDVLVGFQLLVRLHSNLDETGFFTILDEVDSQASPSSNDAYNAPMNDYAALIEADASYSGFVPPIQALELAVTQAWLQFVNLRIQQTSIMELVNQESDKIFVLLAALDRLLNVLEMSSSIAIEALGITMLVKISVVLHGIAGFTKSSTLATLWPSVQEKMQGISHRLQHIPQIYSNRSAALLSAFSNSNPALRATKTFFNLQKDSHEPTQAASPSQIENRIHANSGTQYSASPISQHGSTGSVTDYAYNNNYDRLFDAVAMAGVQSSDNIEDLFGQTSFEPYHTFDETPLHTMVGQDAHNHFDQLHNQTNAWYDPT